MAWGFLRGLFIWTKTSDYVPSFREMLYQAGQEHVRKWKSSIASVLLETKVTNTIIAAVKEHKDRAPRLSYIRSKFAHKHEVVNDSMSQRDKSERDQVEDDKGLKKMMKDKGIVATHKISDENGNTVYVPPMRLQGDVAMETNTARMRRAALRRSPAIKTAIMRWWCLLGFSGYVPSSSLRGISRLVLRKTKSKYDLHSIVTRSAVLRAVREDVYDVELEQGAIGRKEYVQMCIEIWRQLGEQGDLDEGEARRAAVQDWKEDVRGQKAMTFPLFFDALFQLVDLYAVSVEEEEYVMLLSRCIDLIMESRNHRPIIGDTWLEPEKPTLKTIKSMPKHLPSSQIAFDRIDGSPKREPVELFTSSLRSPRDPVRASSSQSPPLEITEL